LRLHKPVSLCRSTHAPYVAHPIPSRRTLHLFAEQLQLHNLLTQKTTDLRIGQRLM